MQLLPTLETRMHRKLALSEPAFLVKCCRVVACLLICRCGNAAGPTTQSSAICFDAVKVNLLFEMYMVVAAVCQMVLTQANCNAGIGVWGADTLESRW